MARSTRPGLPSKEALATFIAEAPGKVGKREIVRTFKLGPADRAALKDLLRDLAEDGTLGRRGKRLHRIGHLPPVVLADITGRDGDGELIAVPAEWAGDDPPPRILVEPARRGRRPGAAPGIGDRALLRVRATGETEGPPHVGRVIKLLSKAAARVIGIFRARQGGGGEIEPVDKKQLGRRLAVPPGEEGGAGEGDLVSVDVVKEGRFGVPRARVRERLGSLASERAVSLIAIHTHGIPHVFPPEALAEADAAKPAPLSGREDWRRLPLVTIDPPDAKDHDDAVHAAPDTDPANPGGHVVTVAIADVAWYVRPGSALDREALERGNSVYFPDRVVPMLPERISNDLCSLRPGEDRAALAVRMIVTAEGRKIHHSFHRIAMRSAARLAYGQAQAAIEGRTDEVTAPLLEPVLHPLWAAYESLRIARDARGPLDIDLPERKIRLKPDGTVEGVSVPERLDAHRLIEEFMILANVAAAEELTERRVPPVFRVHDAPSMEKAAALREFLATLDISLPKADEIRPRHFNHVLSKVAGTDHAAIVNEVVLRSQAQAEYATDNYGHFGLALRRYAHFTSPIRRYADLVVHRALIRAGGLGAGGLPAAVTPDELAEVAVRISAAERRAMAAERETVDRLIAHFLADRIGATFAGRISGVTGAGLFVVLDDTGASGFVPAATLGRDYFAYDGARHLLAGESTGEAFQLGDRVEVKLVEAAPVAGALRFELLSEGRYLSHVTRSKRGGRRLRGDQRTSVRRARKK